MGAKLATVIARITSAALPAPPDTTCANKLSPLPVSDNMAAMKPIMAQRPLMISGAKPSKPMTWSREAGALLRAGAGAAVAAAALLVEAGPHAPLLLALVLLGAATGLGAGAGVGLGAGSRASSAEMVDSICSTHAAFNCEPQAARRSLGVATAM